jgi:hypothetical protein
MIAAMKAKTKNTDPATSSGWGGTARAGQRGCTPRGRLTALRRLELPEEIERALHIRPDHAQCQIRRFHLVLAGLVSMTLVLAAVVWWQLLT